jgi:hypothetical protein
VSHHPLSPPPSGRHLAALLDDAHAALPADELAGLLVSVRRITGPADGLIRPSAPRLSDAGRARLEPVVRELAAAPGTPDGFGSWLRDYLDDVAARPRGSALPHAA